MLLLVIGAVAATAVEDTCGGHRDWSTLHLHVQRAVRYACVKGVDGLVGLTTLLGPRLLALLRVVVVQMRMMDTLLLVTNRESFAASSIVVVVVVVMVVFVVVARAFFCVMTKLVTLATLNVRKITVLVTITLKDILSLRLVAVLVVAALACMAATALALVRHCKFLKTFFSIFLFFFSYIRFTSLRQ